MARGALILVEGLDRTGKTTQTGLLVNKLKSSGRDVELLKFPDRTTPIGKLINSYLIDRSFELSDESAHLLFSANRWELVDSIKSKLKQGKTLILDRYVYSGVAYTAAKGMDRQWSLNPDIGLPKPDLTIFLNLNDSSDRAGFGDERYEVKEFQLKVKKQFESFFNESNWNTIVVDGKNIQQVEAEIWSLLEEKIINKELGDDIDEF